MTSSLKQSRQDLDKIKRLVSFQIMPKSLFYCKSIGKSFLKKQLNSDIFLRKQYKPLKGFIMQGHPSSYCISSSSLSF